MGAGRIIHMDITRIDQMIASGEFLSSRCLVEAMGRGRARNLHLLGLLSDGGVHSHMQHLFALLRMAREQHVGRVFIHCFMDGRDTPRTARRIHPAIAAENARDRLRARRVGDWPLLRYGPRQPLGAHPARLSRRRSRRFTGEDRRSSRSRSPQLRTDVTDEFVDPIVITESGPPSAPPVGPIRDDDAVIFSIFAPTAPAR